ncbi:dihydrodipicolinate synthase family protein [Diaminobutyricibacter sp. McL0618]|uniref:dihydrodipicolinate synthase family protein n=1 Tax=Leifsonia sp. McL0618 TaxID=3415677 RepID=UPI003CF0857D
MPHSNLSGLIPILATPFDTSGRLDVPSLRRLIDFQLASSVDGIAVFGMASEGFALTARDRGAILRELASVSAGSVPIVAGVAATSTVTAVEQAHAAVEGGAHALMVLPPFMVKPNADQLVEFYGTIASESGVPVMVQDAPGATGVTMSVPLIAELSRLAGVDSIKVEAPPTVAKTASVVAAVRPGFVVFGGQNSQMVLEEYSAGAIGTMPACEFPDLLRPVLLAFTDGEHELARDMFARLLPLILFGLQPGLAWAVHKEVLVMRGIIESATVRSPASPVDGRMRESIRTILTELELAPARRAQL